LFFSTGASSRKNPLAATVKAARILFGVAVQTRQKRHFRPDLTMLAVDEDIKRSG